MPRTRSGEMVRPKRVAASIPVYSAAWMPAVMSTVGPESFPVIAKQGHSYFPRPSSSANVKCPAVRWPALGIAIGPSEVDCVCVTTQVCQRSNKDATAAAIERRNALVGDLELQPGMDHVGVVSDSFSVRGVQLWPTLRVTHLGLRDVGKRVAGLDRVRLRRRVLAAALTAALLHDALGLGLFCRVLIRGGTAFASWHVTPPSPMRTRIRRARTAKGRVVGNSSRRPRV